MRQRPIVCIECGEPIEFRYVKGVNDELFENQMCFTDNFWRTHLENDKTDPRVVVTEKYEHYLIGPEDYAIKRGPGRGFDGHKFYVDYLDGRTVTTTNLWSQGTIPPRWRRRFTPNANIESYWTREKKGQEVYE